MLGCCLLTALSLALGGCQEIKIPGAYRIDIQQGNVITQAQLAKLEAGMERRKVRFILGTPLVADAFNQDRWDYYYSYEPGNGERVQRIISVFFDEQGLIRISGDVRAADGPIIVEERRDELVKVPPGLNDESLFASLTPGFLSERKKTIDLSKLENSPEESASDPKPENFQAPDVEITDADREFLTDLLKGYGKTANLDLGTAPVSSTEAEQGAESQTQAELGAEEPATEGEGLFSRWARRLGLKDDEDAREPATTEEQNQPDTEIGAD